MKALALILAGLTVAALVVAFGLLYAAAIIPGYNSEYADSAGLTIILAIVFGLAALGVGSML